MIRKTIRNVFPLYRQTFKTNLLQLKPFISFCSSKVPTISEENIDEQDDFSFEIKGTTDFNNTGMYAIMYTCKVCETQQMRKFTKQSYHKGVILVRCEGCDNLHLIADNLCWFRDEKVNIEDLMKEKGDAFNTPEIYDQFKKFALTQKKEQESLK